MAYGATAGLPDFAEIVQIALFGEKVHFIVKTLMSWYDEFYSGFHLEKTDHITLVEQQKLSDVCPVSLYCCRKAHGDIKAPHLSPVLSMTLYNVFVSSVFLEMEPTVRFQVLIDHEVKKLTLKSGLPSTVDELVAAIKEQFAITTEISVQYKDEEFNDFFTLTTTKELKDKDTLKVVYVPLNITLSLAPQESTPDASSVCSLSESVTHSDVSDDTVILSPSPSERQNPWPAIFPIPTFSHNTELALSQGNEIYLRDGTLLTSPSVKADYWSAWQRPCFATQHTPMIPRDVQWHRH